MVHLGAGCYSKARTETEECPSLCEKSSPSKATSGSLELGEMPTENYIYSSCREPQLRVYCEIQPEAAIPAQLRSFGSVILKSGVKGHVSVNIVAPLASLTERNGGEANAVNYSARKSGPASRHPLLHHSLALRPQHHPTRVDIGRHCTSGLWLWMCDRLLDVRLCRFQLSRLVVTFSVLEIETCPSEHALPPSCTPSQDCSWCSSASRALLLWQKPALLTRRRLLVMWRWNLLPKAFHLNSASVLSPKGTNLNSPWVERLQQLCANTGLEVTSSHSRHYHDSARGLEVKMWVC